MNRALFLDRDGVVNVYRPYVYRIEDFEFRPGILPLCRAARDRGFKLVIITNQAGIARGLYGEEDFQVLMDWVRAQLRAEGIILDGIYHCPHHPDFSGPCDCRKPAPGMLLRAQRELDLDLSRSVLIGDRIPDMEAGCAAGVGRRLLVDTTQSVIRTDCSYTPVPCRDLAELIPYLE